MRYFLWQKILVVTTSCSIPRELIGKERGLLFKSRNLASLLKKLQSVLSQPDALMTMTQKAYTYITVNHHWNRVTYGNLSLYFKATKKIDFSPIQHNLKGEKMLD